MVIYLDEDLKSGTYLKSISKELEADGSIKKCIWVGIEHHGNYEQKRRRDFIQGHYIDRKNKKYYSEDKMYGQSENFHDFLKEELIPQLEKDYHFNNKTIIGHSLGGLFVVYSLLKEEPIFDNYLAISPSLWVNYQNIFRIEEWLYEKTKSIDAKLYFSCGGLETVNLIRYHTDLFENRLKKRKYKNLEFKKNVFSGKTHISVIQPSLEEGLIYLLENN